MSLPSDWLKTASLAFSAIANSLLPRNRGLVVASRIQYSIDHNRQPRKWLTLSLQFLSVAMLVKAFALILYEYRYYFPLDFQRSNFLMGREAVFSSVYYIAFYVHLFVAPVSLLFGLWLYFIRTGDRNWHKRIGRIQFGLVLFGLVPSGMVMATGTMAGPVAMAGFVGLSLATAFCVALTTRYAISRQLQMHRRWATRSILCLLSPILLRMFGGVVSIIDQNTIASYQFIAWGSWVIPLMLHQLLLCVRKFQSTVVSNADFTTK